MLQTYVRGMHAKRRSAKSKFYDIGVDVDFPDLVGVLSASQIGGMFAAELVDMIRQNWGRGKTALGADAKLNKGGETVRAIHKAVLDNTSIEDKLPRKERFKREVVKNYILIKRSNYTIEGVRTRVTQKAKYVPELDAKPLMSSGLMHDSLAGTYIPSRRRMVNNQSVTTQAWIRLRVANARNSAAYKWGGLRPETSQQFVTALYSRPGNFRYTQDLLNSALTWQSKRNNVSVASVMRAVYQVMKFITKV